ncbi:spermidine/putrescine transport system permease protein [Acholeplasma morum]|uniref:ABC transporter permease n=1 Tax=Paracholeplasma morum TaxID=264637 RepID=UPI00195A8620|nr:ABC transporter permease [Paracholeplasma morum]MBM7453885.1 spermidine/putrescine transport system permease protein [Paracholeplasma morum]
MFRNPVYKEKSPKKKLTINSTQLMGIPYYGVLIALILIPVILIVFYAVTERVNDLFITFSLTYFRQFINEPAFIKTMFDSIKLAVYTTVVALMIGYPTAYLITKTKKKTQSLLILILTAPMWVNMLLRTLAWKQLFEMFNADLLGTDFAIITGMVYVFLPFMVLPIYTVLSKIDPKLYEAADDLGASKVETFFKVTLPLSISGILSGITMVLLPAATTLVIPKYLGKNRYLIGNLIENRFLQFGDWGYGSAIAIILSALIMVLVYLTRKLDRNPEAKE